MHANITRFFKLFAAASYDERMAEMPALTASALVVQNQDLNLCAFTATAIVDILRILTGEDTSATGVSIRQQMEEFMAKRA